MRYIKKLEIKNFMTHKHTILELASGINVITGDTASGKSNIIRALVWVFYNHPIGDKFIRYGTSEATVRVDFDDGISVIRGKNRKDKNYYRVIYDDGNDVEFNNFGHNFPIEVKEALKLNEVRVSDKSSPVFLNLCAQLEQPFFVNDNTVSGSERAKWISTLMQLDDIDGLTDGFTTDASRIQRQELKAQEFTLKESMDKLENFANVDEKEKKLKKAQKVADDIDAQYNDLQKLIRLQQILTDYRAKVKEYKQKEVKTKKVLGCSDTVDGVVDAQNKLHRLVELQKKNNDNEKKITEVDTTKSKLKPILLLDLDKHEKCLSNYVVLSEIHQRWGAVENKLQNNTNNLNKTRKMSELAIQKYVEVLNKMSKCPICLTDIDDDVISHIEEALRLKTGDET